MRTITALFVGLGSIGTRHLKNLHNLCTDRGWTLQADALRSDLHRPLRDGVVELLHAQYTDLAAAPARYDMVFITNPTSLHVEALQDVVSRKAVRSFECFGDGIHLFWEGNPKALYEFKDGDKQPVNTYASFEHDSRYSDNIVENAYVDELTNFFAVLKGTETPRWSFTKDLAAIQLMDKIEEA